MSCFQISNTSLHRPHRRRHMLDNSLLPVIGRAARNSVTLWSRKGKDPAQGTAGVSFGTWGMLELFLPRNCLEESSLHAFRFFIVGYDKWVCIVEFICWTLLLLSIFFLSFRSFIGLPFQKLMLAIIVMYESYGLEKCAVTPASWFDSKLGCWMFVRIDINLPVAA